MPSGLYAKKGYRPDTRFLFPSPPSTTATTFSSSLLQPTTSLQTRDKGHQSTATVQRASSLGLTLRGPESALAWLLRPTMSERSDNAHHLSCIHILRPHLFKIWASRPPMYPIRPDQATSAGHASSSPLQARPLRLQFTMSSGGTTLTPIAVQTAKVL